MDGCSVDLYSVMRAFGEGHWGAVYTAYAYINGETKVGPKLRVRWTGRRVEGAASPVTWEQMDSIMGSDAASTDRNTR